MKNEFKGIFRRENGGNVERTIFQTELGRKSNTIPQKPRATFIHSVFDLAQTKPRQ
jgi:hypothetical protein